MHKRINIQCVFRFATLTLQKAHSLSGDGYQGVSITAKKIKDKLALYGLLLWQRSWSIGISAPDPVLKWFTSAKGRCSLSEIVCKELVHQELWGVPLW